MYLIIRKMISQTYSFSTFAICLFIASMANGNSIQPRVLLHYAGDFLGGAAADVFARHKEFVKHGLTSILLVDDGSKIAKKLAESGLPFASLNSDHTYEELFESMRDLCIKHKLNTIFCASNNDLQLQVAVDIKKMLGVKLIYVEHNQIDLYKPNNLKVYGEITNKIPLSLYKVLTKTAGFDGFIGVNKKIVNAIEEQQVRTPINLRVKNVAMIKPFVDEEKFLSFHTSETREHYFKRCHGIVLPEDSQIITMLAGFYAAKRHDTVLKALVYLKEQGFTNVRVVFGGRFGTHGQVETEALAKRLGVSDQVCFLDYVHDTEALLYHSDIHVLSSRTETVGLATVEAGLMKKPVLGTAGTGSDDIIMHGQTGFLCKPNDALDMAHYLALLLTDKGLREKMGLACYEFMRNTFSGDKLYTETVDFVSKILDSSTVKL